MDLKLTKETVRINETIYEGSAEQAVDSDVTLPDYCPDILRVLKCIAVPRVNSVQTAGNRITAEGSVLLRTVYVGESGGVHCYEHSTPFSKFVEQKELDNSAVVKAKIRVEYVNCRAVSRRRLDIHGALCVSFTVKSKKAQELLSCAEGAGIQIRQKNITASNLIGSTVRAFSLTDVANIGASKPPVAQIIRADAFADTGEIKIISNKVMIKGEMIFNIMYCADSSEPTLETIELSLPISQVVELAGITDDCSTDIRLELTGIDVIPKADSSGEMRLLDLTARVEAAVSANRDITVPVIADAYSTQYELETENRNVEFKHLLESFTETSLCRGTIDVSGIGVKKVLDMWCSDITATARERDNELVISGTVTACLLICDGDDRVEYIERQIDYEHCRRLSAPCEKIECNPFVKVCASGFVIGTGDSVDVRIEIKVQASVFSLSTDRIIDAIAINEEQGKKKARAALTIYFSNSGESVWDIARRYNTTAEAVMRENSLTEDVIAENTMLLIPGI